MSSQMRYGTSMILADVSMFQKAAMQQKLIIIIVLTVLALCALMTHGKTEGFGPSRRPNTGTSFSSTNDIRANGCDASLKKITPRTDEEKEWFAVYTNIAKGLKKMLLAPRLKPAFSLPPQTLAAIWNGKIALTKGRGWCMSSNKTIYVPIGDMSVDDVMNTQAIFGGDEVSDIARASAFTLNGRLALINVLAYLAKDSDLVKTIIYRAKATKYTLDRLVENTQDQNI